MFGSRARSWTVLFLLCPASGSALAQTATLPVRTAENVIVAAYNVQFIGERDHDLKKLAKIIQHFDVCGIIEIKRESVLAELVRELEALDPSKDWGFAHGIRTHRPAGRYHEAFGVGWRRDRAQLGDGVISNFWDLEEAYRNDPFIVSFKSGSFDFALVLLHTVLVKIRTELQSIFFT